MKKYIISAFAALALMISSCDKETENNSFVTTYPVLELKGDEELFLSVGDNFTDEGIDAFIGDEKVDYQTESDVDMQNPGKYSVTYTVTNKDGYSASTTRTIYVSSDDYIFLNVNVSRTDKPARTQSILEIQIVDNKIYMSDFLGGYYEQRMGYGPYYAAYGVCTGVKNSDGTYSLSLQDGDYGYVTGWGDYISSFEGILDPINKTLEGVTNYAGLVFVIEPCN